MNEKITITTNNEGKVRFELEQIDQYETVRLVTGDGYLDQAHLAPEKDNDFAYGMDLGSTIASMSPTFRLNVLIDRIRNIRITEVG